MQIAVLGGGNGSFAAAGDLTMAGHEVRLWRRDAQAVAAHRDAGCRILVKDFKGRHEVVLARVTTDMAEAVREAELILCPAPATAQADIAKVLAPHLVDGQVVFLPPGNVRLGAVRQGRTRCRQSRRRGLRGNRDAAVADAQARRRSRSRSPCAPSACPPACFRSRARTTRWPSSRRLSRRDRGLRRRALWRADECRARSSIRRSSP